MPNSSVIIIEPGTEPVSLSEAKMHLRVVETAEDSLINTLITAARQRVENFLARQLITATRLYSLDAFPCGEGSSEPFADAIRVPFPKLIAVNSIKYYDTNGVQQTMSASDYQVDARSQPGRIIPAYGKVWPSTREMLNAVEIEHTCGYGTLATDVPAIIRSAIKLEISNLYDNRGSIIVGTIASELPSMAVRDIIRKYRDWRAA